jgi:hypothetical protein
VRDAQVAAGVPVAQQRVNDGQTERLENEYETERQSVRVKVSHGVTHDSKDGSMY